MDNESKQILKDIKSTIYSIDESIKNVENTNNLITSSQYYEKEGSIEYNTISNSDLNVQILSLIFGFIVGYCLIKSFFDGLKI